MNGAAPKPREHPIRSLDDRGHRSVSHQRRDDEFAGARSGGRRRGHGRPGFDKGTRLVFRSVVDRHGKASPEQALGDAGAHAAQSDDRDGRLRRAGRLHAPSRQEHKLSKPVGCRRVADDAERSVGERLRNGVGGTL